MKLSNEENQNGSKSGFRILIYLISILSLLILLINFASYLNHNKYYLNTSNGAVEILQGRFAPMGKKLLLSMPGMMPPGTVKPVYTKEEIFPFAFEYYIDRTDSILEVPGMPDFKGIKLYLNKALAFATTEDLKRKALDRLNGIDIMVLLYKSDVVASRSTIPDLVLALEYLQEAASLNTDTYQSEIIDQKIKAIQLRIKALKKKKR